MDRWMYVWTLLYLRHEKHPPSVVNNNRMHHCLASMLGDVLQACMGAVLVVAYGAIFHFRHGKCLVNPTHLSVFSVVPQQQLVDHAWFCDGACGGPANPASPVSCLRCKKPLGLGIFVVQVAALTSSSQQQHRNRPEGCTIQAAAFGVGHDNAKRVGWGWGEDGSGRRTYSVAEA